VRLGAARAGTLFLLLDHVDDQPQHLFDPGRLGLALLEGSAPVPEVPARGQCVERRPVDRQGDLGVAGDPLADLRPGQLDPVELDVTPAVQLEPDDELEWLE
jgi:hypothetical protein